MNMRYQSIHNPHILFTYHLMYEVGVCLLMGRSPRLPHVCVSRYIFLFSRIKSMMARADTLPTYLPGRVLSSRHILRYQDDQIHKYYPVNFPTDPT